MMVVTVVSLRVGQVTFCASARTSCRNLNGLIFAMVQQSVCDNQISHSPPAVKEETATARPFWGMFAAEVRHRAADDGSFLLPAATASSDRDPASRAANPETPAARRRPPDFQPWKWQEWGPEPPTPSVLETDKRRYSQWPWVLLVCFKGANLGVGRPAWYSKLCNPYILSLGPTWVQAATLSGERRRTCDRL